MADQEETPVPAPDPIAPDTTETKEQQQDDTQTQEEGQKTEGVIFCFYIQYAKFKY